ncbi:hypothetical protein Xen7305DRAFT_00052020 [Xenococcus sp. PCC 7305]|nr:hypothetical protein Xen7305DRAFT_00052020 [Xenococcus sp. PCC 7305]
MADGLNSRRITFFPIRGRREASALVEAIFKLARSWAD